MKEFNPNPEIISWLEDTIRLTQDEFIREGYKQSLEEINTGTRKGRREYLAACYLYNLTR